MAEKFNPREFGIEPYVTHRRYGSSHRASSFVSLTKGANSARLARIILKGEDVNTVIGTLGERCDIGTGGDCIYLYPGDSHMVSKIRNSRNRCVSCSGLSDWVVEHWGKCDGWSYEVECEPFHNGRTVRLSIKKGDD